MKYQIENTTSGLVLGVYEASSKEEALDLLARGAGYESYQAAQEAAPAAPGEIQVTELEEDDESSIQVLLTRVGVAKVRDWLDQVGLPGLWEEAILIDIEEHLWETYPEAPAYELSAQFTRTGRPEILHLKEGDYTVEV